MFNIVNLFLQLSLPVYTPRNTPKACNVCCNFSKQAREGRVHLPYNDPTAMSQDCHVPEEVLLRPLSPPGAAICRSIIYFQFPTFSIKLITTSSSNEISNYQFQQSLQCSLYPEKVTHQIVVSSNIFLSHLTLSVLELFLLVALLLEATNYEIQY